MNLAAFDLVFAAQSFHWLEPENRLSRVARALGRPGAIAIFGNSSTSENDPAHAQIRAADRLFAPSLCERDHAREWYGSAASPVMDELSQSLLFGDIHCEVFDWPSLLSSAEYCDLLGTYSDHSTLTATERASLLGAVAEAVRANGDVIRLDYRTTLFLARAV